VIKKTLATAAIAASVVGAAGAATPAMAIGDDEVGPTSLTGDGSTQVYGTTTTGGYMSPEISLIDGSLNKPCVEVPISAVEDIIGSTSVQSCTENSTSADGDGPLAETLSGLALLSPERSVPVPAL
jgi:hypothetical protein